MTEQDVAAAFQGVFEKTPTRLKLSGEPIYDADGKIIGAEVDFEFNAPPPLEPA